MNVGIYPPSPQGIAPPRSIGGAPARPAQMPCGIDNSLDWRKTRSQQWERWQDSIYQTIRDSNFRFTRWTSSATFASGTNPYIGATLMEDGRIFFNPFGATSGQIYDPVADRVTTPAGSYGGSNAYSASVLLQTGEVCLIPRSQACRVYNPRTNTVRTIGSAPATANAYNAGVLLPDGRVYCVANGVTTAQVIDCQASTITACVGTVPASNGGVLLPDGRVLIVPAGAGAAVTIYDPATNSHRTSAVTVAAASNYVGGVLFPDGSVLFAPSAGTTALMYDYRRDRAWIPAGTTSTLLAGTLLPDGGALLIQTTSGLAHRVYYPATDTMISLPDTATTANEVTNCTVLPDGRVFLYPRNSTTGRGYGVQSRSTFAPDVMLSAYYNKR